MYSGLVKPVFVVGLHRTGSTLLKNMLDANSSLAMATDEMELYHPFKRTFADAFKHFGDLSRDEAIRALVEFIYTADIRGTFWKDYRGLAIPQETIIRRIRHSDRSLQSVISVLLDEYRAKRRKPRVGAKYPLHHSRLGTFLEWYPDAKIILLTRDARAVCASKLNDEATRARKARRPWAAFVIHYVTLGLFVLDYIWFARTYHAYRSSRNVYLVRYEDMVSDPKPTITGICEFCEIPFEPQMLDAKGKPSSFSAGQHKGPDTGRMHNWRARLSRLDQGLIALLVKRSMAALGYCMRRTT